MFSNLKIVAQLILNILWTSICVCEVRFFQGLCSLANKNYLIYEEIVIVQTILLFGLII